MKGRKEGREEGGKKIENEIIKIKILKILKRKKKERRE